MTARIAGALKSAAAGRRKASAMKGDSPSPVGSTPSSGGRRRDQPSNDRRRLGVRQACAIVAPSALSGRCRRYERAADVAAQHARRKIWPAGSEYRACRGLARVRAGGNRDAAYRESTWRESKALFAERLAAEAQRSPSGRSAAARGGWAGPRVKG